MKQAAIIPPALRPGDTIGITCPAGYLPSGRTADAVATLQSWGFKAVLGQTVGTGHHYFSGTDAQRLADLQQMLDNPDIRCILMGRGGYGLSRIIDDIDFAHFRKHPKWICGFSDITVLHSHIAANFGIATLHGAMCGAFADGQLASTNSLRQALTGQPISYPLLAPNTYNRPGEATGKLVGGNLAILAHLTGSRSQVATEGRLLFIEDVGEYWYNIDRMMLQLKRSGQLNGLAGLICGGFSEMKDTVRPLGIDIHQLIMDKVANFNYPVCFDFPAGHIESNFCLPLGEQHILSVGIDAVKLAKCKEEGAGA
ncbi:MAG: LD-carboxypeptidase [Edaphocola sp.]